MEDLNIDLRKEILELSLHFEDLLVELITLHLFIFSENRKALSNKSGSFSAKNKIDLLFDLEIFGKDDYHTFVLFTEFRNQFVHNIKCNTFVDAIGFLDHSRGKRLLSYVEDRIEPTEQNYLRAFRSLFVACMRIVRTKIAAKRKGFESVADGVMALAQSNIAMIDVCYENYLSMLLYCENSLAKDPKSATWVGPLMKELTDIQNRAESKINMVRENSENLFTRSGILNMFFGREATIPEALEDIIRQYDEKRAGP